MPLVGDNRGFCNHGKCLILWYERNSNRMLALRCARYNGTDDQVFAWYQQQQRGAKNHRMLPKV